MEDVNERLVAAWLKITAVLMDHRMVKSMTFNEAFVCNLLNRRKREANDAPVTATWLCEETGMLKSQMNKTLNMLEEKELIVRERSKQDRRKVYIYLQEKNIGIYRKEHEDVLNFVKCLQEQAGADKVEDIIIRMNELADIIKKIEKQETGWQYHSK